MPRLRRVILSLLLIPMLAPATSDARPLALEDYYRIVSVQTSL